MLFPVLLLGCTSSTPQEETKNGENEHHSHSEDIVMMLVKPVELQTLELETEIEVNITNSDHPLTDGNVGFEYWQEGDTKHQFIDATETDSGHYSALIPFQQPGEYILKLHLEKDEIHEHKEWMVTVEP